MKIPIAVLISDLHFTNNTLELASSAFTQALDYAKNLEVPCILAGDLNDSKDIIRGKCANKLISILKQYECMPMIYIIVGNHDLLNEKGTEHSLEFLKPYCTVVDRPFKDIYLNNNSKVNLIPYMSDSSELQKVLDTIPEGATIIMHTGVQTAYMGHYVQDKSSLPKEAFANFRVISGHYHRRQDIKCGRPRKGAVGLFSYLGSPYSQSFSEANDGLKGFSVLYDDGSLELVPTNLRRHLILEHNFNHEYAAGSAGKKILYDGIRPGSDDCVWLKVKGSYQELEKLNKHELGTRLFGHSNYKLEKIYTDSVKTEAATDKHTGEELFDQLIDNTPETAEAKESLKNLWRKLADK